MHTDDELNISIQTDITLDEVRRFYFEHTKKALRVEDAKYLVERAGQLGLTSSNGGVRALFSTLKYKFENNP